MSDVTEPGRGERLCPECDAVVHRSVDFCPECDVSLYREKFTEDDLEVDFSGGGGTGMTRWRNVVLAVLGLLAVALGLAVSVGYVPV